jgi:hypothetical protein
MPIHAPSTQPLFRSIKLESAAAKVGKAGRKTLYEGLNLVD